MGAEVGVSDSRSPPGQPLQYEIESYTYGIAMLPGAMDTTEARVMLLAIGLQVDVLRDGEVAQLGDGGPARLANDDVVSETRSALGRAHARRALGAECV